MKCSPLKIKVLGCHGGEMAGFLAPSLLIDKNIILDAGSFGSVLSFTQQLQIDHILVSHAHCDHVKDLAGFADLVIGNRRKPVKIYASAGAMDVIRNDFFNNRLWPNFFSLPSPDRPVLQAEVFAANRWFRVGHLRVRAIPVSHPVESMAFIVRGPVGCFVYTGDTGPTEKLWIEVNRLRNLKLMMIETKFPNDLQIVANAAGHLTPNSLAGELSKLKIGRVPICLYHLKPERLQVIRKEIATLGDKRIRIMKTGDQFRI